MFFIKAARRVYGFFTNASQFVVPFASIIFCYVSIMRRLTARAAARRAPNGGALGRRSAHREEAERRKNQRTNRMLISMVVAFGMCWLPLNTINFIAGEAL